jgi:hypothetical protein
MLSHPPMFNTPAALYIFVITWLLLRLIDEIASIRPYSPPMYFILRVVIILVALVLCIGW